MNKVIIGLVCLVVIAILIFFAWLSLSDDKVALMFSGAMKETVESRQYAVEASGTNLRVYEWTNKAGKNCTAVFSQQSGMAMDCD